MKKMLTAVLILTLTIFVGSTVFAGWDPADENKKVQKNSAMDNKDKPNPHLKRWGIFSLQPEG